MIRTILFGIFCTNFCSYFFWTFFLLICVLCTHYRDKGFVFSIHFPLLLIHCHTPPQQKETKFKNNNRLDMKRVLYRIVMCSIICDNDIKALQTFVENVHLLMLLFIFCYSFFLLFFVSAMSSIKKTKKHNRTAKYKTTVSTWKYRSLY